MARDVKAFVLAALTTLESVEVVSVPCDQRSKLTGTGLDAATVRGNNEHTRITYPSSDTPCSGRLGPRQLREISVSITNAHRSAWTKV